MNAGRWAKISAVCRMVRKYQGQMVRMVETESAPVPLAKMDAFPRLSGHPFLTVTE